MKKKYSGKGKKISLSASEALECIAVSLNLVPNGFHCRSPYGSWNLYPNVIERLRQPSIRDGGP